MAARVYGVISPAGLSKVPSISITSNCIFNGSVSILQPSFCTPIGVLYPSCNDDATGLLPVACSPEWGYFYYMQSVCDSQGQIRRGSNMFTPFEDADGSLSQL